MLSSCQASWQSIVAQLIEERDALGTG